MIRTNFPAGQLILSRDRIEAALEGELILKSEIGTVAVTGINLPADNADTYRKGNVKITAADLNLGKVENLTSQEILAKLTQAMVEALLNEDYTGEGDSINERLSELESILGIDDSETGGKSVTERLEEIESALDDKLESTDITRVLLETTLGNSGYTGAEGGAEGIYDQLIKKLDASTVNKAYVEALLELDFEDAYGDAEDLQGVIDAIVAAVEANKTAAANAKSAADAAQSDVDALAENVGLPEEYDSSESGTIYSRLDAVEKQASANKTATETNKKSIEDINSEIDDINSEIDDIKEALGEGEDGTSLADRVSELETAVETNKEEFDEFKETVESDYMQKTDLTQAAVLEALGLSSVESANDTYKPLSLLSSKWVEEMVDNPDYKDGVTDGGQAAKIPTGFFLYTINGTDIGVTDDFTSDTLDVEVHMAQDITMPQYLAMADACIITGKATATYFQLKAVSKPGVDLPVIVVVDRHSEPAVADEEEDEQDSKD